MEAARGDQRGDRHLRGEAARATLQAVAAKAEPGFRSANAPQFAEESMIAEADIAGAASSAPDIGQAAAEAGTAHLAHRPAGVAANLRKHHRIGPLPAQRQAFRQSAQRVRRFEP